MADGRRLYWRYTSDDPGAGRVEDLQVTELAAGEMPEGEAPWVKPDRLNERLAVLRALAIPLRHRTPPDRRRSEHCIGNRTKQELSGVMPELRKAKYPVPRSSRRDSGYRVSGYRPRPV